MFTEKEKQIIKALLEEELNYIINYGDARDEVISNYSGSLVAILMKMNSNAPRMHRNRIFDFVRGDPAKRRLA